MHFAIEANAEPIPGYRLIERLGRGGFGEVWRAEAPGGLQKAIKIVFGDVRTLDGDGSHRAEQELKAIQRVQAIRHPYLLSIERYDIVDDRLVIVTELADCNLFDRFEHFHSRGEPGIPRDELLRYLREAAEVLDLMNQEHQLQHLDVKPQNLFLIHDHVKVADFGLVKDLEMSKQSSGGVTPVYAAPETFDGLITPHCDQYSLAIVYQELLTGRRPFAGSDVEQLIWQHMEAPPNLTSLPRSDRPAVAKALAKKPGNRHPSCRAFVQALECAGAPQSTARSAARVSDEPASKAQGLPNIGQSIRKLEHQGKAPFRPVTPPSLSRIRREELGPTVLDQPAARTAPPEYTGNGVLFPAVVIGLGRTGLLALQRLRRSFCDRFGSMELLPHLKMLYLDTDPETIDSTQPGVSGMHLDADEVFLTRLNRASHYLKPRRNARSMIDGWFDPQWLYRIPKIPAVLGQRALGRLAFGDFYIPLIKRLEALIEEVVQSDALLTSDRHTSLGVRTNRPRIYVIAGLGGGTGSGMFLDVAYAARNRLKYLGYDDPGVVGLLGLPHVDRTNPARAQATANAYAALKELAHFSHPATKYVCTFDDRDAALNDTSRPFTRCAVLPLDSESDGNSAADAPAQAADFLFREVSQHFGRVVDSVRTSKLQATRSPNDTHLSTFGLSTLSWPRLAILRCAAWRLCHGIIDRWISRDAAAVRSEVQAWVAQQWDGQKLEPDQIMDRLEVAMQKTLGRPLEDVVVELTKPLTPRGWFGGTLDPEAGGNWTNRIEELLGRPDSGANQSASGLLGDAILSVAEQIIKEWGTRYAQLAVNMMDLPDFRLAGAEEAIAQVRTVLDKILAHHAGVAGTLSEKATRAGFRMQALLTAQSFRGAATEFAELARNYPVWRYRAMVNRQVAAICQTLRNDLSDQLHEINFCRQRLEEFAKTFQTDGSAPPGSPNYLLPAKCPTPEEAVQNLIGGISAEDIRDLDRRMQKVMQSQFTTLVNLCLGTSHSLGSLVPAMLKLAEQYLNTRLGKANGADLFFERYPEEFEASAAAGRAFNDAAPPLAAMIKSNVGEVGVIVVPPGPAGERVTGVIRAAIQPAEVEFTDGYEDIAFYRELPRLSLAQLPQFGPNARAAYLQSIECDRVPPHTRNDVESWLGPIG